MKAKKEFIIKCAGTVLAAASMFVYGHILFSEPEGDIYVIDREMTDIILPDREEEVLNIDINTADKDELTKLNGIGASKAQAIIEFREENGGFTDITDIMKVRGIKEAVFLKIKDFITVGNGPEDENGNKDTGG